MSERNIQAPPSFAVRTRSPLVRKLLIGASALALLAGAGQLRLFKQTDELLPSRQRGHSASLSPSR